MAIDKNVIKRMYRRKRFLKKLGMASSALIFMLLVAHFTVVYLVDWDDYKGVMIAQLEELTGGQVEIHGDVSASLLPAEINVSHIKISYESSSGYFSFASIEDLHARLSFFSLLFFSPSIKSLVLYRPQFTLDQIKGMKRNASGSSSYTLQLLDGKLNLFSDLSSNSRYLDSINMDVYIDEDEVTCSGSTLINEMMYNIEFNLEKGHNAELLIKSSDMEILFRDHDSDGKTIQGSLEGGGSNFARFLSDVIGVSKREIQEKMTKESFQIRSDISFSSEHFIVSDFSLVSDNIDIRSNIKYSANKYDISVDIDKLFMDAMFTDYNIARHGYDRFLSYLDVIIPEGLDLKLSVSGKEIQLRNYRVNSLSINAFSEDNIIKINPVEIEFSDTKGVVITGIISSNAYRTKFEGLLQVESGDAEWILEALPIPGLQMSHLHHNNEKVIMKSNFTIESALIALYDLKIKMGETTFGGGITFRNGGKQDNIVGFINVKNFDVDSVKIGTKTKSIIEWLRGLRDKIALEFNFHNALFNKQTIDSLTFVLNTDITYFRIHGAKLISPSNNISLELSMDGKDIIPNLNLNMDAVQFDHKTFFDVGNLIKIKYNSDKRPAKAEWVKNIINYGELRDFKGDIDINIGEFYTTVGKVGDFSFKGKLGDKSLSIKRLNMDVYGGTFTANGHLGLEETPSIAAGFALNKVNIGEMLENIGNDYLKGNFSINGKITAGGKSLYDIMSSANGEVNWVAKGLNIKGLDINELVDSVFTVDTRGDLVSLLAASVFKGNTVFSSIQGNGVIKGGIVSNPYSFTTPRTAGSGALHFYLNNMIVNNVTRWRFKTIQRPNYIVSADMKMKGVIINPEVYFDIDVLSKQVLTNLSPGLAR